MSDRKPTESCHRIPSITPSKPRDSKDKQIDVTHTQSTIQESEHEAAIESEEKQGESSPPITTTTVVKEDIEKEEEKNISLEVLKAAEDSDSDSGRERLKKHRREVAGRVWIPEKWGKEERLKDWMDCSIFNASLVPSGIVSARAALIEEGRQEDSGGLRIENTCRLTL